MRKLLTFLKTLTAAVAVILLFTACQQFLDDPEDFLSYWASETFVKNHSIDSAHRPDGAGVPCVGSLVSVDITLSVHNPKGFSFVMPTSSVSAGIVEFKELSSHPEAGTDYELQQTGSGTLKLKYNPSLLQKYEQGSRSLNPTITLKATDGRVFKQTYTFGIKSNTPPPKPEIIIAKTNTSPSKYVLCLKFNSTEMTRKIGTTTVPIHKDIAKITINDSPYTLLYKDDNSDFKKPDETSFIERGNVQQLNAALPSASEKWVLYFDTNLKVNDGNDQTSYTITLSDQEGVTSDETVARIEASGPTYEVRFSVADEQGGSLTGIYKGTSKTANGSTVQTFDVLGGGLVTFTAFPDTGWEVDSWTGATANTPNTTATLTVTAPTTVTVRFKKITYKVHFNKNDSNASGNMVDQSFTYGQSQNLTANGFTKTGYTFAGWATSADGNVQYTNQQSVSNLTTTANGTVDLYAKWTANTYTVTFRVADGKGGTLKANYGYNPSTMTSATVQVTNGDSVSFTATPDNGWEVDSWKVDGSTVSSQTGTTYTLSNVTGPKTVTVKFKPGVFDLAGGPGAWKRLKEEVEKTEGAHTITISGEIKATTDSGNNGKISIRRELIIKSSGSSASLNASNLSGIFDVNNKLTLENITLKNGAEPGNRTGAGAYVNSTLIMKGSSAITDCSAHKGGGVYISNGTLIMQDSSAITNCSAAEGGGVYVAGTFEMKEDAIVTPSTGGDENVKGKNDVYLASGKSIDVTGALTNTPAARITPDSYTDGRVLATGAAEKANFTVTPKNGNEHWRYKKKDGVIKFVPATLTVTFVKIKCVEEHDAGPSAEYYWQMKVNGEMISEIEDQSGQYWVAGDGDHKDIDASFTRKFNFFSLNETIPVNIEIWEDDNDGDDHIGTTDAKLMYHYNADAWQWGYRDSGHENGNQGVNIYKQINEGSANEVEFTEEYRHSDGDTDVTIRISWKE